MLRINGEWHRLGPDGTLATSNSGNPANVMPTPVMIDSQNEVFKMLKHPSDIPPIIKIRGSAGMPQGIAVDSNGNVYTVYNLDQI